MVYQKKKKQYAKKGALVRKKHTKGGYTMASFTKLGLLFPDRLKVKVRAVHAFNTGFNAAGITATPYNTMSPLNVFAAENCSGLRWLLSSNAITSAGAQCPYEYGIVEKTYARVFAQTDGPSTTNTSAYLVLYPIGQGNNTDALSMVSSAEMPHASKLTYLSSGQSTMTLTKPSITYTFDPCNYTGSQFKTFRNVKENWFSVAAPTPTNSIYIALKMGTTTAATDATLSLNGVIEIDYFLELFGKNLAATQAPS